MHKSPYCRHRYNNILYQAVFDFIYNNSVPFNKDKLALLHKRLFKSNTNIVYKYS